MFKTIIIATALLATAPAAASPGDPSTRSVIVPTADLDLASADGQAGLAERIRKAAGDVCGAADQSSDHAQAVNRTCRNILVRDASRRAQVLIASKNAGRTLASR